MTIEKSTQGMTVTLKITGWLDTQTTPMLQSEIDALDDTVTAMVIDCAALEYISSAGLRQIVAAYKKLNGELILRGVSEEVMSIIRITGLDKRIKFA